MKWIFNIFLSLLITSSSFAQKFMVLEKTGTRKRFQFVVGESIQYKIKGERFYREDVIEDLVDNVLVFDYGFYTLNQIDVIGIKGKSEKYLRPERYGPYLIVGGLVFLLADELNPGTSANESTLIVSGTMVGTGALLLLLNRKKVKIKGHWRLRIVDI